MRPAVQSSNLRQEPLPIFFFFNDVGGYNVFPEVLSSKLSEKLTSKNMLYKLMLLSKSSVIALAKL